MMLQPEKLGDKEIDFVCYLHSQKLYIQVTLSMAAENMKKR